MNLVNLLKGHKIQMVKVIQIFYKTDGSESTRYEIVTNHYQNLTHYFANFCISHIFLK